MYVEIQYNKYPNGGYPVDRLNCVDNPIAQCAGVFSYNNYYYYTFIFGMRGLWSSLSENQAFPHRVDKILDVIGLRMVCEEVESADEAVELIKLKINENKPPLIYTKYSRLFYSDFYESSDPASNMNHSIAIYRYNSEKLLISIREQGHHVLDTTDEYRSALNVHLTMTEDSFKSLMLKRKSSDNTLKYKIYFLEEFKSDYSIGSYEEMLRYFVETCSSENNQLVSLITKLKSGSKDANYFMRDLNTLIHATHLFFDGVERVSSFMNSVNIDRHYSLKKEYKDTVMSTINSLRKSIVKGEVLTCDRLDSLVNKIRDIDTELYEFIIIGLSTTNTVGKESKEIVKIDKEYRILNNYSGKYLQVNSNEDLESLIQVEENKKDSQVWKFVPTDNGYYNIVNKYSNKAIDVLFTSIEDGASVGQFGISGHWCQHWELMKDSKKSVRIRNRGSAKLLSVASDSTLDGAEIVQTSENNSFSNEWSLIDCTNIP